jgi:hypothetical protein
MAKRAWALHYRLQTIKTYLFSVLTHPTVLLLSPIRLCLLQRPLRLLLQQAIAIAIGCTIKNSCSCSGCKEARANRYSLSSQGWQSHSQVMHPLGCGRGCNYRPTGVFGLGPAMMSQVLVSCFICG